MNIKKTFSAYLNLIKILILRNSPEKLFKFLLFNLYHLFFSKYLRFALFYEDVQDENDSSTA